jgi:hypothetical protein
VSQATFFVAGDPATARNTLDAVLAGLGFTLQYSDAWNGVAERGSKGATIAAGAFSGKSQHMRVFVSLTADPNGNTAVTVRSGTSGWAAGAIGASRAATAYQEVFNSLGATFHNAGVLLGEQRS